MSLYLGKNKVTVAQTWVTADLDNLQPQDKTITPTQENQVITADNGYDYLNSVTVKAVTNTIDANIQANNIREGVEVLGVLGTMKEKLEDNPITINPSVERIVYTPSTGTTYNKVVANAVTSTIDSNIKSENIRAGVKILGVSGTYETPTMVKTITPTTAFQTVTPSTGYVFDTVFVPAVTASIDANIKGENIKSGVNVLGITGTYETPTTDLVVTPSTVTRTVYPTTGKHFGSVLINGVTDEIDSNIQPENIKSGVRILGVDGTYEPALIEKEINPAVSIDNLNDVYTLYEAADDNAEGYSQVKLKHLKLQNVYAYPSTTGRTYHCSSSYDAINSVYVYGDPGLIPSNIRNGISIFGVTGTYTPKGETLEKAYHVTDSSIATDVTSGSTNKYHFMTNSGILIEISTTAVMAIGSGGSISFKSSSGNPVLNIYVNPKSYYKNSLTAVNNGYYVSDWLGTIQITSDYSYTSTITESVSASTATNSVYTSILNSQSKKYVVTLNASANRYAEFELYVLV